MASNNSINNQALNGFTASGGTINIAADAIASSTNIGTGAGAKTTVLGSTNTTSITTVQSGSGGVAVTSASTGDITLNSADTVLIDSVGVLELNSSAGIIGIGNDAVAQNINIGTGAAARVVTVGNITTTTGVVVNSGTGGVAVNTTGAGDVVVTSADTVLIDGAGVVEINSSAAAIGIGNDAVAQNINIGTGAAARTITIGNVTTSTGLVLNSGTGSIALASTGTGDITLDSDDTLLIDADGVLELNSSAGAISIGNDADAQAINIGTGAAARTITVGNNTGATALSLQAGTAGAGAINIGSTANAVPIIIGNVTGATSVAINSGTGSIALASTSTGDITLASADTVLIDAAGVLELNSSAGVIGIGNDAVAQNINIGTGAAARVITVGNISGATAVNINTGSGGSAITATNGAITINSGTGTLSVSSDAAATTVNLGTGGAAKTVTLGSTNTTSTTNLQSGSGGIKIPAFTEGALITSSAGVVTTITGVAGRVLTANAAGSAPSFQALGASSITITGDTGGGLTGSSFTFTGGTTGLAFGGAGSTQTLTFAGITANGGTVSLATDATASAINIGTGAGAKTTALGSTNTTSTTTLQAGSGGVQLSASTFLNIAGSASTSTASHIKFGGNDLLSVPVNESNIFLGVHSGNLAMSGGGNCGFGQTALGGITSGSYNLALGYLSGQSITTESSNILLNNGGVVADANTLRIGVGTGGGNQQLAASFIHGIYGVTAIGTTSLIPIIDSNGQLATAGPAASTIGFSTDANTATVNLATGGAVKTVALGSTNSTSATTVQSGSGALAITSTNGTLTINSGTGALGISTNANATTVSIGTGAAAKTVILGSTNTTSTTTINAGSGGVLAPVVFAQVVGASGIPVLVDNTGLLGTVISSIRYKENVADMSDVSSDILKLRPVTFDYISRPSHIKQVGLIAEEVFDVMPDLVVHNKEGEIESVKYQDLSVLILNELQKALKRIEELEKLVGKDNAR